MIILVRAVGIEPTFPYGRRILSPLRLPFRHARARHALYTLRAEGATVVARDMGRAPGRVAREPESLVQGLRENGQYTRTMVWVSRSTRTRLLFSMT